MPNTLKSHNKTSHQQARMAACFLLFALVLRSLIPIGYMPASNAAASGFMTLTICNPEHGFYTIQVPIGEPSPPDTETTIANECPYGILAQQFFIDPPTVPDPVITKPATARPFSFKSIHYPVFNIRGSPLGPRAPPSVLS
ncbi:MAG: DUF2946 domain-containing protein [Advenella sp.]|jgi:hypothetical protein|uniref:DUF2946 domain-containing protein n=1 Tax=unclassified Advenella TaxID=2685285 RepID=UPI00145CF0CB|nr:MULTISPECIES: DUF2946 domain-containing protein [unclassified Advenella]MDD3756950.1 DUF2946 domain-containing protein [Advenella sp.]NLN68822.1 hypothetical protein [Alcaligenaceae bacterium]